MQQLLARIRVPLGFVCAALAFWLARPTLWSVIAGGLVALVGEAIRVWAAGHIEKGREVTRSGPYKYVRHPLYLGSTIIGSGFMVMAQSVWVTLLAALYLLTTLVSAMRSEEATLDQRFAGEYAAYRAGTAPPVTRAFSVARVRANREYRALIGLGVGVALMLLKI
jgi:protein-S-isoprenylcysteine O-methyltransferase Ste14